METRRHCGKRYPFFHFIALWIMLDAMYCSKRPRNAHFLLRAQLLMLGVSVASSGLLMWWAIKELDPHAAAKKAVRYNLQNFLFSSAGFFGCVIIAVAHMILRFAFFLLLALNARRG